MLIFRKLQACLPEMGGANTKVIKKKLFIELNFLFALGICLPILNKSSNILITESG